MSEQAAWSLLGRLLPLAIGAAVSPMVLVVQLLNLAAPRRALTRSLAFALGCALVLFLWLLCAGWIASLLPPPGSGPDPTAAALNAVFALMLLGLALRIAQQPLPVAPKPAAPGIWTPVLSGLLLMGCNLTSLVLFLPAVQDITRSGAAGDGLVVGPSGPIAVAASVCTGGAPSAGHQCGDLLVTRAAVGGTRCSDGLMLVVATRRDCHLCWLLARAWGLPKPTPHGVSGGSRCHHLGQPWGVWLMNVAVRGAVQTSTGN